MKKRLAELRKAGVECFQHCQNLEEVPAQIMKKRLAELRKAGVEYFQHCQNLEDLESLRIKYLGKRGLLAEITKGLDKVSAAEPHDLGKNRSADTFTLSPKRLRKSPPFLKGSASAESATPKSNGITTPSRPSICPKTTRPAMSGKPFSSPIK